MIRLQLWDTAGQERFKSLIPSYLKDAHMALVVFDLASTSYLSRHDLSRKHTEVDRLHQGGRQKGHQNIRDRQQVRPLKLDPQRNTKNSIGHGRKAGRFLSVSVCQDQRQHRGPFQQGHRRPPGSPEQKEVDRPHYSGSHRGRVKPWEARGQEDKAGLCEQRGA